jgi:hypothetical protein
MGACCFSPTKRDFLWWYWLLLVSIVGIPMLLAVLYVAHGSPADEARKKERGRIAATIFWVGTLVMAAITYAIVTAMLAQNHGWDPTEPPLLRDGHNYWRGYWALAFQFFAAFVAANAINDFIRKRHWLVRIYLLTLCLGFYLFVMFLVALHYQRPAINVMQFLVCMLPAHQWGVFKDSSDGPNAWKALAAFVAAAPLFFLVSYFGEDISQVILRVVWGM